MKHHLTLLGLCALTALVACAPANTPQSTPVASPIQATALSPLNSPLSPADPLAQLDLVYHSLQGGARHIFRRQPGRPPRQLTLNGLNNTEARWSPDGRQIAYTANMAEGRYELYVMNADGSDQRRLLKQDLAYNWGASWSPDGTQILFASNHSGFSQLYVVGLDGENPRQITFEGNNFLGAWSPDGRRIAFTSDRGGQGDNEIYVMNADGSQVEQLTDNAIDDAAPAWSPDGRYLAFHSYEQGVFNIYVYDLERRQSQAVTREALPVRFPAWSPDGRYILATQQPGEREFDGLVIAFPEGQVVQRLPGAEEMRARPTS
ncbi:MAG: DPP IV N-terminal domain-containing protein [Anaerolineae bacterium]|nr:DPP IV N-terminal domain-containing protein [Thermoflexales bacterium]MDW8407120.1 DPP IV N-terminal domain-containing protein [Anaerolineae bacterium]